MVTNYNAEIKRTGSWFCLYDNGFENVAEFIYLGIADQNYMSGIKNRLN
jgi:hypothetical protein